jgi:hypothetical protein
MRFYLRYQIIQRLRHPRRAAALSERKVAEARRSAVQPGL